LFNQLCNKKKAPVRYAQPIVTYAQPVVQPLNYEQPIINQKNMVAQPIYQPTYTEAPIAAAATLTTTAPAIQKGYGANVGLGGYGYGGY